MGQFFSFRKKEIQSAPLDATSAAAQASSIADTGHPLIDEARARAEAELQSSGRRRGRPSKDSSSVRADSRALHSDIQAEIQRQLEGALDPKAWSALLALPADTALAITGREHWKISKDERDTLGATGSALARAMMIANPKWLCALMLASAVFSCYVPRGIQEMEFQKQRRAMQKKAEKVNPSSVV